MKISLALDNCFAMKRWTQPEEWMAIAKSMDIHFIEASADNEIDPLYSTPEHFEGWLRAVREASEATGVRVANLYSGHGTYCTLGLAHPDPTVRLRIRQDWMRPMIRQAAAVGAGLGFYVHAFSDRVMNDPACYEATYQTLIADLRDLAVEAQDLGMGPFGIEQMYSPHQIPWTIAGASDFLARANTDRAGAPVYLTLDTGHQSGQRRFLAPTEESLAAFREAIRNGQQTRLYAGTPSQYRMLVGMVRQGASFSALWDAVGALRTSHPYLFSGQEDGDPYGWLEALGAYSPIIHLQQTDGASSGHKPFTAQTNASGIIEPKKVLQALQRSCEQPDRPGLPKADHVYLTLEVFLSTACDSRIALDELAESAAYWRRFVPRDGMSLEQLLQAVDGPR